MSLIWKSLQLCKNVCRNHYNPCPQRCYLWHTGAFWPGRLFSPDPICPLLRDLLTILMNQLFSKFEHHNLCFCFNGMLFFSLLFIVFSVLHLSKKNDMWSALKIITRHTAYLAKGSAAWSREKEEQSQGSEYWGRGKLFTCVFVPMPLKHFHKKHY